MRHQAWQIAMRLVVLAAAIVAAVVHGGTGGKGSDAHPVVHSSPAPAPKETTSGTAIRHAGFATSMPPGWVDATKRSNAKSGKHFAAVLTSHGIGGAVVVSAVPAAPNQARVLNSVVTKQDGFDVVGPNRYHLAGAHGVTESFKKRIGQGVFAHDRLILVTRNGVSYVIVFTAPAFNYQYASGDLAEMLHEWRWTR